MTDAHDDVLASGQPDAGYEYFWLMFKDSVGNAAQEDPDLIRMVSIIPDITRNLNIWKKEENYIDIRRSIQTFLKAYLSRSLLLKQYHRSIAYTNLKRWLKCCEHVSPPYDPLDDIEFEYLYFLHRTAVSHSKIVQDAVLSSNTRDTVLSKLLLDAVLLDKRGIMDKLLECYHEWTLARIQREYGVVLPKQVKNASKVLRQIQDILR